MRRHGRAPRLTVVDDSDHPEHCKTNLGILESIKEEFALECIYAGPQEKEEFARNLAKHSGVKSEVVNFALLNDERCPIGTGGNRNALLLSGVGEITLQVDDDSVCAIAPSPDFHGSLTLTSQYDPTEFWFLSEEERPLLESWSAHENVLALHEQLLGKSVGTCLRAHSMTPPNLEKANTSFFRRLRGNSDRIAVTALGKAGDSGIGSSYAFLKLTGAQRDRLLQSQESYRYAMDKHQVLRSVTNPTISNGTYLSGMNLGLDNRRMLPPFMPVQRNQDGIFAALVRSTAEGYFGFLPWMLVHQRPERWKQDLKKAAATLRSGDIIEILVSSFKPRDGAGAKKNLVALGLLFKELGSMAPDDFQELVQKALWRRALFRIGLLDQLLRTYQNRPHYWANDVSAYISAMQESLPTKNYVVPVDLADVFGVETAAVLMRRLVRRLGELLEVWCDLREAALSVRSGGCELGRRL